MIMCMGYPGGKGKTYQHLVNLMPPHRRYIETHLGSGAVLRNKLPAEENIGIDIDPQVISTWSYDTIPNCDVICGDALSFLTSTELRSDDLVYMDPPYVSHTRRRKRVYRYDYSTEDHKRLIHIALSLPCMVLISGYRSELYDLALENWQRYDFQAWSHSGMRTESVWFNFERPTSLHDSRYIGGTFRERQNIQRRLSRVRARLSKLSVYERVDILHWLEESIESDSEREQLI